MLGFWMLALLLLLLIVTVPTWSFSRDWGYGPAGILLALVVIWLLVLYLGFVAFWWPWATTPVVPPS